MGGNIPARREMLCGGNKPCLPTHGKSLLKEGKNMKKHLPIRLLSMLLVLAMCVGLVVPSFAAGSSQTASLEFEKLDDPVSEKLLESALDKESVEVNVNDDFVHAFLSSARRVLA